MDLTLDIERAVAGGRMLARHDGQVVLVAGAIPGERVRVVVERVQKGVTFARVVEVVQADAARRDPGPDPACGGLTYAHVALDRQRVLKAEVVADAFARIAKHPLAAPPVVHASPERGYRMRVRLHVRDGRLGSFREGTHEVCPLALTKQASEACEGVVDALGRCLEAHSVRRAEAIEIAENLKGDERVVHVECAHGDSVPAAFLSEIAGVAGITGVSSAEAWSPRIRSTGGTAWVSDPVAAYVGESASTDSGLRRHARAFFQANRFLAPALVRAVLERLPPDAPVVDLYAGVGLFAVCAAAKGSERVTAVEGDPVSAVDLEANAAPYAGRLRVAHKPVEQFLGRGRVPEDATVIVDPPRTGISKAALDGLVASRPARLVYVSCDVATLARDARRFLESGYVMGSVEAFDLFPNTAHVEALTEFRVS
jgi:23S rRNA (uracil1939-C5)-methyltransferase